MKRAAIEKLHTLNVWKKHKSNHLKESQSLNCVCDEQAGRFRKGQRVGGCGNARCYTCHPEKLLKIPKHQIVKAIQMLGDPDV